MATTEKVKNVTQLERVEHIDDRDCLVLVRFLDDGSQQAMKFFAKNFRGEDAYQLAREKYGFSGTYEDWQKALKKVVDVQADVERLATTSVEAQLATVAARNAANGAAASASQANTAATNADTAAQKAYDKIEEMTHFALDIATGAIAPSRMNIEVLHDISTHNKVAQRIAVSLLPSYLPQSVLFQRAEGDSLVADPSGNLYVKGEGTTKFWVIPTANTPLWQEVSITVRPPRMRLSASGKLRLSAGGKLRIV